MDEFEQRGIMISEQLTGLHSAVTDRFSLVFDDADAEKLRRISFSREEAERMAVWLRCRLDNVSDRPKGPNFPHNFATEAETYGKVSEPTPELTGPSRDGTWYLRIQPTDAVPFDMRDPDALARWIERAGITYQYRATEIGTNVLIFRGCVNVPEEMPSWVECYRVGA